MPAPPTSTCTNAATIDTATSCRRNARNLDHFGGSQGRVIRRHGDNSTPKAAQGKRQHARTWRSRAPEASTRHTNHKVSGSARRRHRSPTSARCRLRRPSPSTRPTASQAHDGDPPYRAQCTMSENRADTRTAARVPRRALEAVAASQNKWRTPFKRWYKNAKVQPTRPMSPRDLRQFAASDRLFAARQRYQPITQCEETERQTTPVRRCKIDSCCRFAIDRCQVSDVAVACWHASSSDERWGQSMAKVDARRAASPRHLSMANRQQPVDFASPDRCCSGVRSLRTVLLLVSLRARTSYAEAAKLFASPRGSSVWSADLRIFVPPLERRAPFVLGAGYGLSARRGTRAAGSRCSARLL